MAYIWLSIIILLALVEFMTINLTTIWFVISALLALAVSFFTDNFFIQFLVFVLTGIILLITTRPILQKFFDKIKVKTNADRVIGMHGIVTEEIKKEEPGEVKVDGKRWTAIADKKIKENSTVEILEIIGVKLKVKEIKEEE